MYIELIILVEKSQTDHYYMNKYNITVFHV